MLERIFYQRDKNKRRNGRSAIRPDIENRVNSHLLRHTDAHQLDVVANEVYLFAKRNEHLLIVVKHISKQLAQLLNRLLGLFPVKGDKGINIVERIEQKMGIHLIAEIPKFSFSSALHRFPPLGFRLAPTDAHTDSHAKADTKHKACHVAQIKGISRRRHAEIVRCSMKLGRRHMDIVPPTKSKTQKTGRQKIDKQEPLGVLTKQYAGNEQTIVEVKDDAQRQRHWQMTVKIRPVNGSVLSLGKEQRKKEKHPPAKNVD